MNIQELTRRSSDVADMLKVMANGHRLCILCELNGGERSVSALEDVVGLSQSALSQHLAKLRESGVVTTRRDAQTIYYALGDPRVEKLISVLYELFCARAPAKLNRRRS